MSYYALREEGKQAFLDNVPMLQNPYPKYSDYWYDWNDGWRSAWYRAGEGVWR